MIKAFRLSENNLTPTVFENGQVIFACPQNQQEQQTIHGLLPIAKHDIHASLDPKEIGWIDFHDAYHAFIIKTAEHTNSNRDFSLDTNTIGLFLTPQRLFIITSYQPAVDDIVKITGATSLTSLLLKILFATNQHFHQHLRMIHDVLNEWEKDLGADLDREYFQHIYALQKGLVFYINALDSNHKCIERISINKSKLNFNAECEDLIDDLLLDTLQSYQQAKDYADILGGLSQTMAAIVNNQLNERIKKLTIISLCVMLPTLVVSLFSMNVDLPVAQHGTTQTFWFIILFAIISVLGLLWLWKTRRW